MDDKARMTAIDHFWTLITQTKFDLCFYAEQYRRSLWFVRLLTWIPKSVTAIAVFAWMQWSTFDAVTTLCPIAIFLMQAIEVIAERLPFDSRTQDLNELANDLQPVFRELEDAWRLIAEGKKKTAEINSIIHEYSKKIDDIKRHYLKKDALPENKKIINKASAEMQRYFANY